MGAVTLYVLVIVFFFGAALACGAATVATARLATTRAAVRFMPPGFAARVPSPARSRPECGLRHSADADRGAGRGNRRGQVPTWPAPRGSRRRADRDREHRRRPHDVRPADLPRPRHRDVHPW